MQDAVRNVRLEKLKEREKELNCLYNVEKYLNNDDLSTKDMFQNVVEVIPPGFQYTTVCEARVVFEGEEYKTNDFQETEWMQSSDIVVDEHVAGNLDVAYSQLIRLHRGSAFLPEEQKLLNTIAGSIGRTVFRRQLKSSLEYLSKSGNTVHDEPTGTMVLRSETDEHWKWRTRMADSIAKSIDLDRFGLKGLYLIGSTKNANAGPASDIDFIAHFDGGIEQKNELKAWMEGWGLCLDEMNYARTGYCGGQSLIDIHIITDEDIKINDSYASMISAVTDRARPLKIRNGE